MPKEKPPHDVTDAEFTVLTYLWQKGTATTREIADAIYPGKKGASPTVLKLLERLESKQCVTRDSSARVLKFSATIARDDLIEHRLNAVADDLCEGSRTPLLMHLVDPQKLTSEEIDMLRSIIEELEESNSRKKRK